MPETNFEASLREASHSWRALRRRRARPPVPIPTGKEPAQARIATFQTALEQAEQQFRAASTVAYDSRALNLYYGLQQAGRAIAATSPQLDNTDYTLNGHGLEITPKLGSAPVVDIGSMRLRTSPRPPQASFNRISMLLGSDVPESFTLKQMWPSLVEPIYARNASLCDAAHPPLSVYLPQYNAPMAPAAHQSASPELPFALRESASWPNVEDY